MSKELIRLSDCVMSYDDDVVLDHINLTIKDQEFLTLLGPSGCGKTTTLRIIGGFLTPTSGDVLFDGVRINDVPPHLRTVNTVFQKYALFPHLNVFENVAFGLRSSGNTENLEQKVSSALHAVRLDAFAGRYPHQLSGGQQQRVAFARAIVIEPKCILFDEPLSALDALLREEMRTELRELTTSLGITSVFVTHDQTEAMSMSDKIAVLSGGIVEQYDSPEVVYAAPKTEFVARFVGSSNWIDAHHMFRPENASMQFLEQAQRFETQVLSAQFLGGSYQLRLKYQDEIWALPSAEKLSTGRKLPVYIEKRNIITL